MCSAGGPLIGLERPLFWQNSMSAKAEHLPHAGCIRQQLGLSRCITDAEPTAGVGQTAEQIFFKQ